MGHGKLRHHPQQNLVSLASCNVVRQLFLEFYSTDFFTTLSLNLFVDGCCQCQMARLVQCEPMLVRQFSCLVCPKLYPYFDISNSFSVESTITALEVHALAKSSETDVGTVPGRVPEPNW